MGERENPVLSTDLSHPGGWSDVADPDRAVELRIAVELTKKAVVLASSESAVTPPLETPSNAWGLLVYRVQVYTRGAYAGRVKLFTGVWLRQSFQLSRRHEGLVVIQVDPPSRQIPSEKSVRVRLLQACVVGQNLMGWNLDSLGWNLVGEWDPVGVDWPRLVAPTALALMNLYGMYSSYRWGE